MRKVASLALACMLGLSLVPGAQAAAPKQQKIDGSIVFPAPFAQGTFDGCWGGLNRRVTTPGGGEPNGVFGYGFDVDKATWNKNFVLEVTGGEGTVDLDLFLYLHYPAVDETPNDPVNGGTPVSVDFTTRGEGGEAGKVPPNTVRGIVCMYAGPTHQGFNSTFTYTAGKGVKPPKG